MKRLIVADLVLALVWCAVSGSFGLPNIVLGLMAGALSLFVVRGHLSRHAGPFRPLKLARLMLLFLYELGLSAWKVSVIVLRPNMRLRPGIIAFPLTLTSDSGITLLANLITLTPGTLSIDVSPDRRTLYVHMLDCAEPAAARREIADGFERRIREALE